MIVVDEIEAFINSLDLSSEVISVEEFAGANKTRLFVGNVFHARPNLYPLIDGVPRKVLSVDYAANSLFVEGEFTVATTFVMPSPFYFHGTPYATNAHISRLSDDEKVPMIYLLEIVREELQEEDSAIETVADLKLFFLDVANYEDWTTDEHYSMVIMPLRNLLDAFVSQARTSPVFGEIDTLTLINHIKFGVYVDNKGHLNSIFNERLSGIELRGNFPFRKKCC